MPQEPSNHPEYFADDPRFHMSLAGRMLVRIVSYVGYLVFGVAAFMFTFSPVRSLSFVGVFLLLVLVDLVVHRKEGDLPIAEFPKRGKVNLAKALSPTSFGVIDRALDRSAVTKHAFYLEIIDRLIDFQTIQDGLRRLDVKYKEFRAKLDELLAESAHAAAETREVRIGNAQRLVIAAYQEAAVSGRNFIAPTDLFAALAHVGDETVARLLNLFSIEAGDLSRALIFTDAAAVHRFGKLPDLVGGLVLQSAHRVPHRIMNRAWTSRPTPVLDKYSTDLTDLARDAQAGFLIGHDAEYERMVEAIGRPVDPNAILIGEPGIGKDAMLRHLAFALIKDEVPRTLFDKRLVELHLQMLVAGAAPEELGARLRDIVDEIFSAGNVILYIPDIHNLVHTSGTAYLSAADALLPVIKDSAFPVIGSTYPKEYKQMIEPRTDFAGSFEAIMVNEITEEEAERLLSYEGLILERQYKIIVSFGAVKRAVVLAKKYFHAQFLPSSAEELLKSAIVDAERRGEKTLTAERITSVAEEKVNVPMHEASKDESDKLINMEALIHERLIGQDEAVHAVSEALREYRSGLTRRGGPIASFLFVGPTGVGKTELAKILASIQFGSEKAMVRFDMTEYQDNASVSRFIGSPDGTVRGALTDAVMAKPYSLILLDEFEKAYPDILNLFLQVLDDGRLTDGLGRTVDFTDTIIIATSNAHSDIVNEALSKGESMDQIADYLRARLVDVFKAELINRFSKVIIFKNLAPADLASIAELNLRDIVALVKEQGIYLEFAPEVPAKIGHLAYDPAFGARPIRRVIDGKIREPLSNAILGKKIVRGNKIRCVVASDGESFDFIAE